MSKHSSFRRSTVLSALLLAAACSGKKSEPEARGNPVALQRAVAAPDAAATPKNGGDLSDEELVAMFIRPELRTWSEDEARQRLAQLELAPSSPLPDSHQLVSEKPRLRVSLNYLPDEGGVYRFADARVELPEGDGAHARARYEALARRLEKELGAPVWRKDDESYPARGYRIGERLEVMLGAMTKPEESPPMAVLSLAAK